MSRIAILLIALFLCLAIVQCRDEGDYKRSFMEFMLKYQKQYSSSDFAARYNIFKKNVDFIDSHNAAGLSYTVAINQFADLTQEEFSAQYKGLNIDLTRERSVKPLPSVEGPTCPTSNSSDFGNANCDWRQYTPAIITPIKNQGQCGSCWSFSTTGSVEGQHSLSTGNLVGLSEQQLVDCSGSFGNEGCDGGLMDDAFQYIIANKGIVTEASYPYTGVDGTCSLTGKPIGATISNYSDIVSGSEPGLQAAIIAVGPVSVAIDASGVGFQFYFGGVYHSDFCSSTKLDHGVLAVGLGVYKGSEDYYIVKNSWGASWGLSGYIMMSRNRNNNCGIATSASYPIV